MLASMVVDALSAPFIEPYFIPMLASIVVACSCWLFSSSLQPALLLGLVVPRLPSSTVLLLLPCPPPRLPL